MKVVVDVHGSVREPNMRVQDEHVLAMMLRHGAVEVGARRSTMQRVTFQAGEMGFHPRHSERWVGTGNQERLLLSISDTALRAAREGIRGTVELGHWCKMVDTRLAALVKAVNAERIAGFTSGRLFLDSIEQAIAAALVDAYAGQNRSVRELRGGLGPARLRLVKELVHAKMEDELTLAEMAKSAELSPAHFSRMFRKSTGETPHQFVLRQRVERAKEMLREAEMRVLDVAVACGFKTQQHFARVFRRICGASPTEYRYEVLR
ncbi:MAG TPA: helix-turn-helix domain-containing protein [Candidatus Binatia bacterium]|nr:helix-turn-helix domain-containing protein [Candidatus Binatia bacterium]